MKALLSKNILRLTALGMIAGSMIGIAGPAQAKEHILLARQVPVPVAVELDLADPTDPQEARYCHWHNKRLYCITLG